MIEVVASGHQRTAPMRARAVGRELRERKRGSVEPPREGVVAHATLVKPLQLPDSEPRKDQRRHDREDGGEHVSSLHGENIAAAINGYRRTHESEEADLLSEIVRVHRRLPEQPLQLTR